MKMFERMAGIVRSFVMVLLIAAVLGLPAMAAFEVAYAATTNPSPGAPGYMLLPFHISGQYTASTTAVAKWTHPYPCEINHAQATARASGGTSPTLSVVVKNGANTVATMAVTAGTVTDGSGALANTSIADEATMSIDLTIGGTSPTWNDIVVMVGCRRQ